MIAKIQIYIIMILLALVPVVFIKGCQYGGDLEEANNLKAVEKLRIDMLNQQKLSADKILAENRRLKSNRRASDVRLKKLLEENVTLKDWWNTDIPNGAVDYIYGMRSSEGDKPVPDR